MYFKTILAALALFMSIAGSQEPTVIDFAQVDGVSLPEGMHQLYGPGDRRAGFVFVYSDCSPAGKEYRNMVTAALMPDNIFLFFKNTIHYQKLGYDIRLVGGEKLGLEVVGAGEAPEAREHWWKVDGQPIAPGYHDVYSSLEKDKKVGFVNVADWELVAAIVTETGRFLYWKNRDHYCNYAHSLRLKQAEGKVFLEATPAIYDPNASSWSDAWLPSSSRM